MSKRSVAKGFVAGISAGIVATLVMDQFQKALAHGKRTAEKREKLAQGEARWTVANEMAQEEMKAAETEGSTVKVAEAVAHLAGTTLAKQDRVAAGQAVHYVFGTLMGVAYGVGAELAPAITSCGGTAFGTALFLGADEVAVPALKLSGAPTDTPASGHLEYWAAHLVYGGALELTRGLLRRLI